MALISREQWRAGMATPTKRFTGFKRVGYTGNHVDPTQYTSVGGAFKLLYLPDGRSYSLVDVPNLHWMGFSKSTFPAARNKAWAKLVDKTRASPAQLGVALAEGHEALGMIAGRATSLYRFFRDLRRGRFRDALRSLSVKPRRRDRNRLRNTVDEVSSLWLEYSFGWKPMIQDIHDAMEVLQKPVPGGSFSGSGSESYHYLFKSGSGPSLDVQDFSGTAHVKQGGSFFIESPNLYLMQQLGIANPAQIVWELVPFSFMVDWVFDVGSFLGGFSDLLGLKVVRPYCTFYLRATGYRSYNSPPAVQTGYGWRMVRETSLSAPVPNAHFFANLGTSMNRAANAVSLLGQILTK